MDGCQHRIRLYASPADCDTAKGWCHYRARCRFRWNEPYPDEIDIDEDGYFEDFYFLDSLDAADFRNKFKRFI